MPRFRPAFKKRKNVFNPMGRKKERIEESESDVLVTPSQSVSQEDNPQSSTSKSKFERYLSDFDNYSNIQKYDIIEIMSLFSAIKTVAVCRSCGGDLELGISKRNGLKVSVSVICETCDSKAEYTNSETLSVSDVKSKIYAINARLIYGLRCIGIGKEASRTLCAILNLPPPPTKFVQYTSILESAVEKVAKSSMKEAIEEAVELNGGSRDLTVALDGSWQKRGFSSLNGIVSASSFDTGKILDVHVMSKHCLCPERQRNVHSEGCKASYTGSSGGMEVEGAKTIFERSKEKNVRYAYYLGDGDSKGFAEVANSMPYGEEVLVQKLECIGHVQKRMGTRLKNLKKKKGKTLLNDKKPIGGKGRLTDDAILKIQKYYGLAIRRNTEKDVNIMKQAIWAEYFHLCSTDANPSHNLCPKDDQTWCKFHKFSKQNKLYKHSEHFHLPASIMSEIKPIFRDLAQPDLLKKCLHGQTQNLNESYNNVLWSVLPKRVFVHLETLKLGAYEAVATFNIGPVARCKILKKIGIEPGAFCIAALKDITKDKISNAEYKSKMETKEARQERSKARRKLEEELDAAEDNPYASGTF